MTSFSLRPAFQLGSLKRPGGCRRLCLTGCRLIRGCLFDSFRHLLKIHHADSDERALNFPLDISSSAIGLTSLLGIANPMPSTPLSLISCC
ncbi:hypothetical protein PO124_20085 [Bacillus licheniformis]|nr:hypothetical protein [Bacillus licheniformis]